MNLLILGAAGNSGRRLVRMGLALGHDVTAFARSERKLADLQGGQPPQNLKLRVGDVTDKAALIAAMSGQHAVVNAAGNATQPDGYVPMVASIIAAAEQTLGAGGRLWLFGGAAALDVPGTKRMTADLPMVPAIFQAHKANFERVSKSNLDWSMLCPGPMTEAPDGTPHRGLRISADIWPVARPPITRFLPLIATTIAFRRAMPQMTITYEDAAQVILNNLASNGPFARKRVGIALPVGLKGRKELPSASARTIRCDAQRRQIADATTNSK